MPRRTKLFVIRQLGTEKYWCCSTEHSCGWNDGNPKQSFSPSELTKQLQLMIDNGWVCSIEILELKLPEIPSVTPAVEPPMPVEWGDKFIQFSPVEATDRRTVYAGTYGPAVSLQDLAAALPRARPGGCHYMKEYGDGKFVWVVEHPPKKPGEVTKHNEE